MWSHTPRHGYSHAAGGPARTNTGQMTTLHLAPDYLPLSLLLPGNARKPFAATVNTLIHYKVHEQRETATVSSTSLPTWNTSTVSCVSYIAQSNQPLTFHSSM